MKSKSTLARYSIGFGAFVFAVLLFLLIKPSIDNSKTTVGRLSVVLGLKLTDVVLAAPQSAAAPTSGSIEVRLDHSQPMGGYLSASGADASELQRLMTVLDGEFANQMQVASAQFERLRFPGALRVTEFNWMRKAFDGTESPLELQMSEIQTGMINGQLSAAVVGSDLVGTGALVGSNALGQQLRTLLATERIRSGQTALVLAGFRLPYFGVAARAPQCQRLRGNLGCWLSENGRQWKPLERPAVRPFYLVLLGPKDAMRAVAERLVLAANQRKLEAEWLDLSEIPRERILSGHCAIPPEQGLRLYNDHNFECLRKTIIPLNCTFAMPADGYSYLIKKHSFNWPSLEIARVQLADNKLSIDAKLDCAGILNSPPKEDLKLSAIVLPINAKKHFGDWSTSTDFDETDISRTLGLEQFISSATIAPLEIAGQSSSILKVERKNAAH